MPPDIDAIENAAGLVVMYHYVGMPAYGCFAGYRGPGATAFELQVRRLAARFEPMDWPTYRERRQDGLNDRPPAVLFTFDDGLRCQAETAARVLESVGARGVFFVPTGVFESPRLLDAHKLHLLLSFVAEHVLIDDIEQTLCAQDALPPDDEIEAGWRAMYHYERPERARLKYLIGHVLPVDVRRTVLDELFTTHVGDEAGWAARWYGDAAAWRSLADRGHTIGGHGHSHEPLAAMTEADLRADLAQSAEALSKHFGRARRPMSYPFGRTNAAVARFARDAGFEAGFTTVATGDGPACDAMHIPRVDAKDVDAVLETFPEVGVCTP